MSGKFSLKLPPHVAQSAFDDGQLMASALADCVAAMLRLGLWQRGDASLLVSGGRSPVPFLRALSQRKLEWSRVSVSLVDERWLPPDHPDSNAGLVRANLLQGAASAARFVPLYGGEASPEAGLAACEERRWDFMGHGMYNTRYLWGATEDEERAHIAECVELYRQRTGRQLQGWLSPALSHTLRSPDLVAEAGIRYYCDLVHDDQPWPARVRAGRLITVPYSVDLNDAVTHRQGYEAEDYARMAIDTFDTLWREGEQSGRVMCIAVHPYNMGQPHRIGQGKLKSEGTNQQEPAEEGDDGERRQQADGSRQQGPPLGLLDEPLEAFVLLSLEDEIHQERGGQGQLGHKDRVSAEASMFHG